MSLHRTTAWLIAGALVLLSGLSARAEGPADMQLFAPAEVSEYGGGPRPNEGYFFSAEWLHWNVGSPDKASIGDPGRVRRVGVGQTSIPLYDATATPPNPAPPEPFRADILRGVTVYRNETNTEDTGWIEAGWVDGNRVEVGCIGGHHGWLFSSTYLPSVVSYGAEGNVQIAFDDPPTPANPSGLLSGPISHDSETVAGTPTSQIFVDIFGVPHVISIPTDGETRDYIFDALPVTFRELTMWNSTRLWSTELNYVYRFHPTFSGCQWELFLGCRYMEFNEKFNVEAFGSVDANGAPLPFTSALTDSFWNTTANNRIVGPQVGGHVFWTQGRFTLDFQGRFFAGFNSQNIEQIGELADKMDGIVRVDANGFPVEGFPTAMRPTGFEHHEAEQEWAPGAELRLTLGMQLTRSAALTVGWTGYYQDGLARPSALIRYRVPDMGITTANNRQDVFINGVNVGIQFNR